VVGARRVQLAAAVGSASVVMGLVLGQDRAHVPLTEDQHPVGDLGPGGEHEPLRKSVRSRASGRDLHGLDAGGGEDGVERIGELPSAVAHWYQNIRAAGWCVITYRGADHTVAGPMLVDRATARSAYPRYERLALRLIGIDEFVWLADAPTGSAASTA
jgi:hypothetical protein